MCEAVVAERQLNIVELMGRQSKEQRKTTFLSIKQAYTDKKKGKPQKK